MRKLPPPRPAELARLSAAGEATGPRALSAHEAREMLARLSAAGEATVGAAKCSEPIAEHRPRVQLSLLGDSPEVTGPASDECYTPSSILDPVAELLGGIDTDPAWSTSSLVRPRVHGYTIAQDGLTRPWAGSVWLNPPYSKPGPWVQRAAEHAAEGHKVALLVNNDPSTQWWRHTLTAGALGLWPTRIHFAGAFAGGGAARFSCALLLWHVSLSDCAAKLPKVAWYGPHGVK